MANFSDTYFKSCLLIAGFIAALPAFSESSSSALNQVIDKNVKQERVLDELEKEQTRLVEELKEKSKNQEILEKQIAVADSNTEKLLLSHLLNLKEHREQLSRKKLEHTDELKNRIDRVKSKSQELAEIEQNLKLNHRSVVLDDFENAIEIWREVVDRSISFMFVMESPEISPPPTPDFEISQVAEKYNDILAQISAEETSYKKEVSAFEKDSLNLFKTEREMTSLLLLKAGRVRAAVMQDLLARDLFSVWSLEAEQLKDYFREVQIVPYRFVAYFATKIIELRSLSNKNIAGWVEILKQIFLLIFVFAIPFLLFKGFRLFSGYLENVRKNIFTHSQMDYRTRTKVALWIAKVNPYLPWIFAWLSIKLSHSMLQGTLLDPLTVIMPYLTVYVLYRAFLILFSATLAKTLLSRSLDSLRAKQSDIKRTAKRLSMVFFIEWLILLTTEDVVRRALVYSAVSSIVFYLNLIIIALESSRWKNELLLVSKSWLNNKIYEALSQSSSKILAYITCPLLFLGNVLFLLASTLYRFFSRFEFGKKLSSEIFKKRLEDAASDTSTASNKVSEDYKSFFNESRDVSEEIRISLSRAPVKLCLDTVNTWYTDKSHDDMLVLYGSYGIGKTSLLNTLEKKLSSRVLIKKLKITTKVTDSRVFYRLLSEALGASITSLDGLLEADRNMEKTVLMIDDIHNLFLNTPAGLSAYKTLVELTNLQVDNLFWCMTVNQRALNHLNGIFGNDHLLGKKVELLSWTDAEIQDLILKRHTLSGFQLYYDNVISAVHKGDILESSSDVEVQFFRLLWGQSRGNPLTAQELWLTSVSQIAASTIRVTVPKFANSKSISELSDDVLMVLSIIAKHENLSFDELLMVSGLPQRIILSAIKIGEDNELLEKVAHQRRWRMHPKSQYVIQSQLFGRNYLYG